MLATIVWVLLTVWLSAMDLRLIYWSERWHVFPSS